MKKILLALMMMISISIVSFSQIVSTGLGIIGSIDTWQIVSPAPGNAFVISNMFPGTWENTPVAITGAKWISVSTGGRGSGMTDFVYEKTFPVSSGIKELKCNFNVAVDDELKKIELVNGGTVINIPFTKTTNYHFVKIDPEVVKCPKAGEWKLRITVFCGDPKGSMGPTALLVSGDMIQVKGECCKIPDEKCNPSFTAAPFTLNSQCNIIVNINPVVTGGAQHYWGLLLASGLGDNTAIPLSTILSGGSFGLGVNSTGNVTALGMGTGITASTSGYGYQYQGVAFGKCFKITHYIKCCNKWYSQTNTYCTKLCSEVKEGEVKEVPVKEKDVPNLDVKPGDGRGE
jgi:hypothetical protein